MVYSEDLPEELCQLLEVGRAIRTRINRGRFAPSPSGPLHLGNLRTALVSWLRTRINSGEWLLRIDDLDEPRNCPGAIENIQKDLIWLGLNWDGPTILQSQRRFLYESVITAFHQQGKLYPCRCSRRLLATKNRANNKDFIYPGTCRNLGLSWQIHDGRMPSLRLRVGKKFLLSCGDIVIKRADGFIAYHLATVADELSLGISDVVRGNDLAKALPSQLALIEALGQKPARYMHVPLVLDAYGNKLSKRDREQGLSSLVSEGLQPQDVIGLLASSLDLVPKGSKLSAAELLGELKKDKEMFSQVLIA